MLSQYPPIMDVDQLTDKYLRLHGWTNPDELLGWRDRLRAANPTLQTLFILDDEDQASYQSSHATSDLWLTGEEDLSEFSAIMVAWLRSELDDATLELDSKLTGIGDRDINLLHSLEDYDTVFPSPLGCLLVESVDPSMAIAALPNGYFLGDLTPAQNYLLAEQLRAQFGLEVFGLGASFAAFCRPEVLSTAEAAAVVGSVKDMYYDMTDELADEWAAKTVGRRWFLLSYRGA